MLYSRFSFRAEHPFKADIYILADCGQDFQKRKQMGDWMMILFHKLRKFYEHLRTFGDHFSPSVLEHGIFLTLIFFFFFFLMPGGVWIIGRWRYAEGCMFGGSIMHWEQLCALQTLLSLKPVFEAGVLKSHLLMKELNQRLKQLAPNQRGSGQVSVWRRLTFLYNWRSFSMAFFFAHFVCSNLWYHLFWTQWWLLLRCKKKIS